MTVQLTCKPKKKLIYQPLDWLGTASVPTILTGTAIL